MPVEKNLTGTQVSQGNGNGKLLKCDAKDNVLYTYDMGPCVAVCGYNGVNFFLIHSDSTQASGIGAIALIDGIKKLVGEIGTGTGYKIALYGGSRPGVKTYLAENLKDATVSVEEESDGAYLCWNGVHASTKRSLAGKLSVDSVKI